MLHQHRHQEFARQRLQKRQAKRLQSQSGAKDDQNILEYQSALRLHQPRGQSGREDLETRRIETPV